MAAMNPSDNLVDWVLKTVPTMGAGWCPPGMLGIGIGGTAEKAVLLAKESLMDDLDMYELQAKRPPGREAHPGGRTAPELFEKVNALGIGAQGLGGLTTVLDVKIKMYPTHAASKPVAMIPNCAATRHAHFVLDGSGPVYMDPPSLDLWPDVHWAPDTEKSKRVDLNTLTPAEVASWKPGQPLLLNGKMLTGRDAAHKRIQDMLAKGEKLPVDFTNSAAERGPVAIEATDRRLPDGWRRHLVRKAIKGSQRWWACRSGHGIYEFDVVDMPVTVAVVDATAAPAPTSPARRVAEKIATGEFKNIRLPAPEPSERPVWQRPIGVFDSGVGGLSVLRALRAELPAEAFVYLVADSGHAPYGERDDTHVIARTRAVTRLPARTPPHQGPGGGLQHSNGSSHPPVAQEFAHLPIVGIEPALKPAVALAEPARWASWLPGHAVQRQFRACRRRWKTRPALCCSVVTVLQMPSNDPMLQK